jgi:hypothetical protein
MYSIRESEKIFKINDYIYIYIERERDKDKYLPHSIHPSLHDKLHSA